MKHCRNYGYIVLLRMYTITTKKQQENCPQLITFLQK